MSKTLTGTYESETSKIVTALRAALFSGPVATNAYASAYAALTKDDDGELMWVIDYEGDNWNQERGELLFSIPVGREMDETPFGGALSDAAEEAEVEVDELTEDQRDEAIRFAWEAMVDELTERRIGHLIAELTEALAEAGIQ